jgi:magnesium-transporting ATPase (P-type)
VLAGTRKSRYIAITCLKIIQRDLRQAGDIVEQLKAGIALRALVVRDGREQEIEARDLVPGDIVSRCLGLRSLSQ